MLEAIGQHAEGKSLNLRQRIAPVFAVSHYPRQFRNFSDPPAVVLALQLDCEGHVINVPSVPAPHKRSGRRRERLLWNRWFLGSSEAPDDMSFALALLKAILGSTELRMTWTNYRNVVRRFGHIDVEFVKSSGLLSPDGGAAELVVRFYPWWNIHSMCRPESAAKTGASRHMKPASVK